MKKVKQLLLMLCALLTLSSVLGCSDDTPTEPQPESSYENNINGHEYVDLGLPSGLLWATCNVGATNPEDYGDYFAWGETVTKSEYIGENSVTIGREIGDISGNAEYDAARANWGGTWRMPTDVEIRELIACCIWKWTSQNGVNGCKITGPNGNSIFLPAVGLRVGLSLLSAGSYGFYWSSTPNDGDTINAEGFSFYSGNYYKDGNSRDRGRSIRPISGTIQDETPEQSSTQTTGSINGYDYIDLDLPSGLLWAVCNVGGTNPEDYGDYYAWGEIETKSEYTEENSVTFGKEIGDISGNAKYDAARANWGDTWRLPTLNEIDELINHCTWIWTTQNGVNGYKVIGKNGNSIFLPAAGCRYGSSLGSAGSYGLYWSSTPYGTVLAYYFGSYSDSYYRLSNDRSQGRSVRPVSGEKQTPPATDANGHEYVDLGLSVKWATCNVGGTNPEDYGDYYAWGETTTKSTYAESNSALYGKTMSDISGDTEYDAARANWGGTWRMPTNAEFSELITNCTWEWITQNEVNGYKVTGPNGNSIFLPAAGWRSGSSLYYAGSEGYYWSSIPIARGTYYGAYVLDFNFGYYDTSGYYRSQGRSVRPVIE